MTTKVMCPNCLRHSALKKDGTMYQHVVEPGVGTPWGRNWCKGSNRTPQDCIESGDVARDWAWFRRREAEGTT